MLPLARAWEPWLRTAGKDAGDRVELATVFSNRSASFLKLNKVRRVTGPTVNDVRSASVNDAVRLFLCPLGLLPYASAHPGGVPSSSNLDR